MTRSYPDWGRAAPVATVAPLADLGELAARLGSINTYDRRGNVAWLDDFESGLSAWSTTSGGVGGTIAQSSDAARSKQYSAKFVTGAVNLDYMQLDVIRSVQVLGRLGLEVSFTGPGTDESWSFLIHYFDGDEQIIAQVFLTGNSATLSMWKTGGVAHDITLGYPLYIATKTFHTLKFVADFATRKWVRLMLDHESFDLSGIGLYVVSGATRPILNARASLESLSASAKTRYLDDVIITQNEP